MNFIIIKKLQNKTHIFKYSIKKKSIQLNSTYHQNTSITFIWITYFKNTQTFNVHNISNRKPFAKLILRTNKTIIPLLQLFSLSGFSAIGSEVGSLCSIFSSTFSLSLFSNSHSFSCSFAFCSSFSFSCCLPFLSPSPSLAPALVLFQVLSHVPVPFLVLFLAPFL